MICWLFIIIFSPLCWGEAPALVQGTEPLPVQEQNLLILIDLQGALFFPKTAGAKVASLQNQKLAESNSLFSRALI